MNVVRLTVCLLFLSLFSAFAAPWWDDYPLFVETARLDEALKYAPDAAFCATFNDPSWGLYGQRNAQTPERERQFKAAGLRTVSYYETFGTSTNFIAELGERGEHDCVPVRNSFWSWKNYSGGPIVWIGMMNYWGDEEFARPYTWTHAKYGSRRLTYPDGTPAEGYTSEVHTPLTSRVLDACSSKNVMGSMSPEYTFNETVNAIEPATGKPAGPLDGLVEVDGRFSGHINIGKDPACPFWIDHVRSSILYGAERGMDGIWTDNYGPWDNFGFPPVKTAFGEWSVAGFRTWLRDNVSAEDLQRMGVGDIETFDVRAALRSQVRAWGGDDTNIKDPFWLDARWQDSPLWRAYSIYKRRIGTQALDQYYGAAKESAAKAGKTDFFIASNDIPFYSLGWPRGELDIVSTELTPGWHMGSGSRGIGLPPHGRFGPVYKLAREHAKSRIVNVWMYLDEPQQGKPGVADVLEYEMLAHHALPKLHPGLAKVAGTVASNAAFFGFVREARKTFGSRVPVEEVGLYYSSSSVLATVVPGGIVDFDRQAHQFGYLGWGAALEDLHYQYRAVPEWKLNAETLAGLRVLIIPHAQVFDPELVDSVIKPWLASGGRLIVTGESGARLGEGGLFEINPNGPCLAALKDTPQVVCASENIGLDYYLNTAERPQRLDGLKALLPANNLVEASGVPRSVGLTMYQDETAGRLFIDLNNYSLDLESDQIFTTGPLSFEVRLPKWLKDDDLKVAALAPNEPPVVTMERVGEDRVKVALDKLAVYASIVLSR